MHPGFMLACLVLMMMAAHTLSQDLTVSVVPSSAEFNDKQDVEMILNYKNKGTRKILVYKWYLPDQELFDPLFDVFRNGKRVEYVGPVVKRRPPVAADMISLEPGQSKSSRVRLSAAYNMTVTGTYSIRFNASLESMSSTSSRLLNSVDASQLSDVIGDSRLVSSAVTISTAGSPNAVITESTRVSPQVRATTYTYTGCSTTQKNAIVAAIKAAKNYSSGTVKYLSTVGSSGTTRYITWFGKYSLNNLVTLRTHFTRITDLFNTKSISFNCTCKMANTYAYVYPTITYKIYLCPMFWPSPTTGIDTKGGTLVHEGSHFTVVADTDDHAYGQAACKTLAKNSPSKAINNADSHQYFTENYPSLK